MKIIFQVPEVQNEKREEEGREESDAKFVRVKQKTLEEKIFAELAKYDNIPFDEEYAEKIDMSEFRKLKLVITFAIIN